jgi:hypothetical protein
LARNPGRPELLSASIRDPSGQQKDHRCRDLHGYGVGQPEHGMEPDYDVFLGRKCNSTHQVSSSSIIAVTTSTFCDSLRISGCERCPSDHAYPLQTVGVAWINPHKLPDANRQKEQKRLLPPENFEKTISGSNRFNRIAMSYFDKSFPQRRIVVERSSPDADNPDMKKRLIRIETNYSRLDDILTDLEARFEFDDRLLVADGKRSPDDGPPRRPR